MEDEDTPLIAAYELDLAEQWQEYGQQRAGFLTYLRGIVSDPDTIDEIKFCGDCGEPGWEDELTPVGDIHVCESCHDENWSSCDNCGNHHRSNDMDTALGGSLICESCSLNYYLWCETCCGRYHEEDDSHDHDDSCECESPQQRFSIRNGSGLLANDTRATVTLPGGVISGEGLEKIRRHLWVRGLPTWTLENLDSQWQTKTGNYTKRLSRHMYTTHQVKLTPDILSQVGCIARDHSTPVDVTVEFTRDLNQPAYYFYNEDSCWWGSYSDSRCALKTNGGLAMRSFDGSEITGRAWILPLRQDVHGKLTPTFDTQNPDAFMVFNGYGDLDGYTAPRVLAYMTGWTYRKTGFGCDHMYINSGGYLVAPENLAEQYTNRNVHLSVEKHARLYDTEKGELANA